MKSKLVFIRHAESESNACHDIRSSEDCDDDVSLADALIT
jgi:broad specificity phosphatase PhoE